MAHLHGRISSVISYNEETGEAEARIAPHGENPRRLSYRFTCQTALGFIPGESVALTGDWQSDPKGKQVFRVTAIERVPPATREGEIVFLAGYIKGMTKTQAAHLLQRFGGLKGLIEVCQRSPQLLDEALPKARKVRARLRLASWDRRELDIDAFVALQSAGLRPSQIQQLRTFFGSSALRVMAQTTPYDFCQVPKVGFQSAEKVARFYAKAQGRPLDLFNEERLVYGLLDVVSRERNSGHVCVPEDRVIAAGVRYLELPRTSDSREKLREALGTALKRRLLIKEYDLIYTRGLQKAESDMALHLSKMVSMGTPPVSAPRASVLRQVEKLDPALSEQQREAVATLARSPVAILTGGPGRGKTRVLKAAVGLLEAHRRTYMVLAPTGKAAKRASEVTGRPAYTIHKACGLDREEDVHDRKYGGKLHRRARFNVDVIICDEASMVDLALGFELARRCRPGRTALWLVGDPDQLPPVSAGQVLVDLISSGAVPRGELTQVFRQANGSAIVDGADALNSGNAPVFARAGHEVRLFDPTTTKDHPGDHDPDAASDYEIGVLQRWLVQAIRRYSSDLSLDPMRDIQVFAPQKDGPLGLNSLNATLQRVLNPPPPGSEDAGLKIDMGFSARVGDKVIQTRNNYRMRSASASNLAKTLGRSASRSDEADAVSKELVQVMNGQVGVVTRVDTDKREMEVTFDDLPEPVLYLRSDEWRQLAPAYAISIHRSQGSETPYGFIVLHDSMNPRLVNRPLIYTGWTRAKSGIAVFATRTAVERAAQNIDGTQRYSSLGRRLRELMDANAPKRRIMVAGAAPARPQTAATA